MESTKKIRMVAVNLKENEVCFTGWMFIRQVVLLFISMAKVNKISTGQVA